MLSGVDVTKHCTKKMMKFMLLEDGKRNRRKKNVEEWMIILDDRELMIRNDCIRN